jgi:UDP-2-acetamido-3-amino-2,3-dideoxy-glucuronate N-acetyltransferase
MIHPTAEVSSQAQIGAGTRVWNYAQIREDAVIGENCIIGKNVYIDFGVRIGDNVKIQNNVLVYHGLTIEDGVFLGPQACLTNDRFPRAITPDGQLKGADDWEVSSTLIRYGASIGASATVLAGLTIGRFAMVGAGAVVTHSVPDHGLVLGVPARLVGYVCRCGRPMEQMQAVWQCNACGWSFRPPAEGANVAPHSAQNVSSRSEVGGTVGHQ